MYRYHILLNGVQGVRSSNLRVPTNYISKATKRWPSSFRWSVRFDLQYARQNSVPGTDVRRSWHLSNSLYRDLVTQRTDWRCITRAGLLANELAPVRNLEKLRNSVPGTLEGIRQRLEDEVFARRYEDLDEAMIDGCR